MRKIGRLISGGVLIVWALAGCQSVPLPFLQDTPIPPTVTPTETTTPTPVGYDTPTPGVTPLAPGTPVTLTIWLPPQFDPNAGTPAGDLLKARLEQFSQQHAGVSIQVRLKAPSGPASLLDSLAAASAAAPMALPDLVILSRDELESASLKGLIIPLDGLTQQLNDPDWYNYARQMSTLQGSHFGLPFAGDALALLYRPANLAALTSDWNSVLRQYTPLAFPAVDPQAMVTLALYESVGGPVVDSQGRPTLSADALAQVLSLYNSGSKNGIFPAWLTEYDTDGQAWEAYREDRAQMVVTWISHYLSGAPADTSALPLPPLGKTSLTLSTGWLWALPDGHPDRRAIDVELSEWLVDSSFLAKWSAATGYLPTRPTALADWPDHNLQTLVSQIVLSAQNRPDNDVISALGPVLENAVQQVIKSQADPIKVSQAAVEQLKGP
jgi:multiple sugar transport system substrate-binding protein